MCRIALLVNASEADASHLARLQSHGANRPATYFRSGNLTLVHNRFDVTTSRLADAEFPLRDERYVVHFNGEVFGFRDEAYLDRKDQPSDVHYCLSLIREHGVRGFLRDADFQGTFQIHDSWSETTYLIADQLNSVGAFYAEFQGKLIAAQESFLVHSALELLGAGPEVPIRILQSGCLLKIDKTGGTEVVEYRPDAKQVYGGSKLSVAKVEDLVSDLHYHVTRATLRRLPAEGPIAVLASGGVDSSVILSIVVKHLRSTGELDRLKVVTFGRPDISHYEENDFANSVHLIHALGLSPERHLLQIDEDIKAREAVLSRHVFCDQPRLITPNPILNSQVRHTVRMSMVLSELVRRCSEAKVVLTGDVADELFAGYHSMRIGVTEAFQLRNRVRDKLADLKLNDSARYTLASLYGCASMLEEQSPAETLLRERGGVDAEDVRSRAHPIEVRTPFSCHYVLRALCGAHPDCLVGRFGNSVTSKFLLRLLALRCGVPFEIARRKKVPFNEGGSGIRNADRDPLEEVAARKWKRFDEKDLIALAKSDRDCLLQLNLIDEQMLSDDDALIQKGYEQLAVYAAAKLCGLDRLRRGDAFRPKMPDSVYSSENETEAYRPQEMLHLDPWSNELKLVRTSVLEQSYV